VNHVAPTRLWLPAATLTLRELQRFARQRSRMMGAFATPVIFWLLIGAGIGRSFSTEVIAGNASYLEYFFPGTFALIVLFTAIFSSMSLIEDRHEGFLQSVLVAPASRIGIALGKIAGSTILAVLQGALFLVLAPVAGIHLGLQQVVAALGAAALLSFALAGLGFMAAWKLDSSQGFHAIMNLVFIPMWILSGALFPAEGASAWLSFLLVINPLTYGVALLRHAMYPAELLAVGQIPAWSLSLIVTIAFAALMFIGSVALLKRSNSV
jgi:ABC-2 type transport system permease protein